ncbi:nucleotide exchange factor GrpE [Gammaproteobacteria bacterium]|nr:nucleotide exchange factor GrpE [Gammaproteobacteria bacterium]
MSENNNTDSTKSLHDKLGKELGGADESIDSLEINDADTGSFDHLPYDDLKKKLIESNEKASQYWERLLLLQADTENIKRRSGRDVSNAHKFALEKFSVDLLPVIDTLERAISAHIDDDTADKSMLDGVSLTLQMLLTTMKKFGIEIVDPIGELFNPELHEAVSTQKDENVEPKTVLNVLQKGYLLNKRLIRPALVIVAN